MDSIWMGIAPGQTGTRLMAMRGPDETILKAHLRLSPSSPRALEALLESIGLWEGKRVDAVLVVDDEGPCAQSSLVRDTFGLFDDSSALYRLQWVPRAGPRRRRDELRGMGVFRDLERLLLHNAAR